MIDLFWAFHHAVFCEVFCQGFFVHSCVAALASCVEEGEEVTALWTRGKSFGEAVQSWWQ